MKLNPSMLYIAKTFFPIVNEYFFTMFIVCQYYKRDSRGIDTLQPCWLVSCIPSLHVRHFSGLYSLLELLYSVVQQMVPIRVRLVVKLCFPVVNTLVFLAYQSLHHGMCPLYIFRVRTSNRHHKIYTHQDGARDLVSKVIHFVKSWTTHLAILRVHPCP